MKEKIRAPLKEEELDGFETVKVLVWLNFDHFSITTFVLNKDTKWRMEDRRPFFGGSNAKDKQSFRVISIAILIILHFL